MKVALEISAYSLKVLADATAPLMTDGGAIVGLTFDATVAWPAYNWMGVAKAALESTNRYLAELGPRRIRATWWPPTDPHDGRQVHPWLCGLRGRLGRPGTLGWDVDDPTAVAETTVASCPTGSAGPPARSSMSTADTTASAPDLLVVGGSGFLGRAILRLESARATWSTPPRSTPRPRRSTAGIMSISATGGPAQWR
ncbi:MAG: SDR family oxidoreductase [Acidimicrobiales bacterium]